MVLLTVFEMGMILLVQGPGRSVRKADGIKKWDTVNNRRLQTCVTELALPNCCYRTAVTELVLLNWCYATYVIGLV